jgi:hypothetical protein
MDTAKSALLLHSLTYGKPSVSASGSSGIWISKDWILTHGTALSAIIDKYRAMASFMRNLPPRELATVPQNLRNELTFQVYRDSASDRARIRGHFGFVAAVWKCRLLAKTFDEFFETWSFPKSSTGFDKFLRSVFLLVRVFDSSESFVETAEQALRRLLERTLRDPVRGTSVEIVSTPFGNPVFIDSIARGIVSNVVGEQGCVIMTDAFAFPGGEGGPVYVISSDR